MANQTWPVAKTDSAQKIRAVLLRLITHRIEVCTGNAAVQTLLCAIKARSLAGMVVVVGMLFNRGLKLML